MHDVSNGGCAVEAQQVRVDHLLHDHAVIQRPMGLVWWDAKALSQATLQALQKDAISYTIAGPDPRVVFVHVIAAHTKPSSLTSLQQDSHSFRES